LPRRVHLRQSGIIWYLLRDKHRIKFLFIKIMEAHTMPVILQLFHHHPRNGVIEAFIIRMSKNN